MLKSKTPLVEPPYFKRGPFQGPLPNGIKNLAKIMDKFLGRCGPKDIIAIFVIVGAFILKFKGIDGVASMILIGICAAYFGALYFVPPKSNDCSTSEPK